MGARPKVCHLSSVHAMDDVRIFHKECVTLAAAGYDVSFVVPAACEPRLVKGVKIVPLRPSRGRLGRMLFMPWKVLAMAVRQRAEVYHFHDPELIFVGCLLKLTGARVVYDVHENVPADILMKTYIPLRWRRLVALAANVVEKSAAMVLDRIVTATPAIARRFPEAKTIALQNFPISGELFLQKGPAYGERPPTVVYVGGITAERGVIEMVRALGLVKPSLGARLVMAGRFSGEALENQARGESGWRCVDYLGHLGREQLAPVLGGARAGLVLFHPGPNHDEAQPNKLFEYMSSGLPLIASHFPLWRSLIDGERCGLLVDPLDPAAIARAIEQILEEPEKGAAMGDRGYAATKTRYNWTVESRKLIDLYHRFDLSAGKATPCAE